jgi:hypothetical protein
VQKICNCSSQYTGSHCEYHRMSNDVALKLSWLLGMTCARRSPPLHRFSSSLSRNLAQIIFLVRQRGGPILPQKHGYGGSEARLLHSRPDTARHLVFHPAQGV